MKLFQIIISITIGIAAGAQPIIGFNYGAGRYDRVKQTFKYVVLWTFIVSAIATVLFEAIPLAFISLFGADDPSYTTFAVSCLRIYLSLLIFTCVQKVCAIFLQSIGKATAAIPLAMIRDVGLLIVFSAVFAAYAGVTGIFWAAPAADVLAIAVTGAVLFGVWKKLDGAGGGGSDAHAFPQGCDCGDSARARLRREARGAAHCGTLEHSVLLQGDDGAGGGGERS
jgi:Na+-driven multidrug efflux pump